MAGGGAIAGIVIAVVIGVPLLLFLCLYLLKKWMQGPTAGTDNPRRLDEKVVVITGRLEKQFQFENHNKSNYKSFDWQDATLALGK